MRYEDIRAFLPIKISFQATETLTLPSTTKKVDDRVYQPSLRSILQSIPPMLNNDRDTAQPRTSTTTYAFST